MPPTKKKPGPKPGPKPGRKPGRPALARASAGLVSIRLTPQLRAEVEKIAEQTDSTLTHVIVTVLQRHLVDVDVLARLQTVEDRLIALERRPQQLLFQFGDDATPEVILSGAGQGGAGKAPVKSAATATPTRIKLSVPSSAAAGNDVEQEKPDADAEPDPEPDEPPGANGASNAGDGATDRPWAEARA